MISGPRRPRRSDRGPAINWPTARPTRQDVIVNWAPEAEVCSSSASCGRAGRYRSRDSGPKVDSMPSTTIIRSRDGAAVLTLTGHTLPADARGELERLWAAGAVPALYGRVRGLQRADCRIVMPLGDTGEETVDHYQLRDPTRHRSRPERGLPGCGGQQQIRMPSDRCLHEVGHPDGGRTMLTGYPQGVEHVDRGAGVRDADGHIRIAQHRRRRQRQMGIRPAEGGQAYPMKLVVQVVSHQGTGADAIEINSSRCADGIDRCGQRLHVERSTCVFDGPRISVDDLVDQVGHRISGVDGAVSGSAPAPIRFLELCGSGQGDPELRIAGEADGTAEAEDGGLGRVTLPGHRGDGAFRDGGGIGQDGMRDALLSRAQARHRAADSNQDGEGRPVRTTFSGPPVFAHRTPVDAYRPF